MPLLMLWGHGSFRSSYGSFVIPPYVLLQFFVADHEDLDDEAVKQFERKDLSNGITPAYLRLAQGVQPSIQLLSYINPTIVKNYKLESILGDFLASAASTALRNANAWTPGKEDNNHNAVTYLKDIIQTRAHTATAADPLHVQWCACRTNYVGAAGPRAATPLATPAPKRRCYITTATLSSLGKGDDCIELTVLRWFRDHVLVGMPGGRVAIERYYQTAPLIVAAIDQRPDARRIYEGIFRDVIRPAVEAIDAGQHGRAYDIYRRGTSDLLRTYVGADVAP